ncbi:hypothetical protein BH11PAT4_BH11PAT4_8920 [soil metagenome]
MWGLFSCIDRVRLPHLSVWFKGYGFKEDKKGRPTLEDVSGIVEWVSDIRGYVTFTSLEDVASKKDDLERIIRDWLVID